MDPTFRKPQPQTEPSTNEPSNGGADASAEANLLDAQARLMEAEAKLMDRNAASAARAPGAPRVVPAQPMARSDSRPLSELARTPRSDKPATEQLPENVAAMVCYLFGWVSGIIFLLRDRRPFVRFHAAQSVAVFATLSILLLALSGFFLGTIFPEIGGTLLVLRRILELTWLVATVVLMLKAAGGERFRVRFASQYADRAAHGAR